MPWMEKKVADWNDKCLNRTVLNHPVDGVTLLKSNFWNLNYLRNFMIILINIGEIYETFTSLKVDKIT